MTDRQRFEQWGREVMGWTDAHYRLQKPTDGRDLQYRHKLVDAAYLAWQAAVERTLIYLHGGSA